MSFLSSVGNISPNVHFANQLLGGGGGGGPAQARNPNEGVFDQKYIDYLNGLNGNAAGGNNYSGQNVDYATLQAFKSAYGRDPTPTEFAMYAPMQGQAGQAIAQQKYQEDNTPDKLYAKQQAQYQANAPQHYGDVSSAFQSLLGRDATDSEKSHFGALLASGQSDPYQLQQILQQTEEYRNTADQKFRGQLQNQLQGSQSDYYNKYILPSIQNQYASQGRSFDSSGFKNSAVQSAQQQNYDLQNYLAGVSSQQYGGNVQNAQNNYQSYMDQYYGRQNQGTGAAYGAQQQGISRQNDLADFNLQQQAYNKYLSNYGRRSNGAGGALSGALAGGVAGAKFGPWGALAGAGLGAGLGFGAGQA